MKMPRNTVPSRCSAKNNIIEKISIIIPAAGTGSRMKSYGPKSLLRIHNKPLIQHQLNIISSRIHIPYEVIIIAGLDADRVFRNTPHDIIKIENNNYQTTNVVRSIGLGINACTTQHVLLIYGDLAFNPTTMNIVLDKSWLNTNQTMSANEVGCIIEDDNIASLAYDIPTKWAQMGFFTGKEFSLLRTICCNRENDQLFGFEAINTIIDKGGVFKHTTNKLSKINDIDSSKDLKLAKNILRHSN